MDGMVLVFKRALGVALLALVLCPNAWADYTYPEQSPAMGVSVQLVQAGQQFMANRGLGNCQSVTTWAVPDNVIINWGTGQSCSVWLSTNLIETLNWPDRNTLIDACQAIFHEVGHAEGLDHQPTGLMSINKPPYPHAWAPFYCVQWSKRQQTFLFKHSGHHIKTDS